MFDDLSYNSFQEHLRKKLQKPLNGEIAHKQMMHEGRELLKMSEKNIKQSAVLIAFYKEQNNWVIPIIKRAKYEGVHSGQMAFPGGKYDRADINLHNTALREAYEETGINPSEVRILGELTKLEIPVSNNVVLPVVGCLKSEPIWKADEREVDKIYKIKLNDLLDIKNRKTEFWTIQNKQMKVPFFEVENEKIWGATAMILSELTTLFSVK